MKLLVVVIHSGQGVAPHQLGSTGLLPGLPQGRRLRTGVLAGSQCDLDLGGHSVRESL